MIRSIDSPVDDGFWGGHFFGRRGRGTAEPCLAMEMKASIGGGRWGKKEREKEEKSLCLTPSYVTPVGSSWTEKYTLKV